MYLFRQHRFAIIKLVSSLHADQIKAGGLAIGVPMEVVDSGFPVAKFKALHHLAAGVIDADAHILRNLEGVLDIEVGVEGIGIDVGNTSG